MTDICPCCKQPLPGRSAVVRVSVDDRRAVIRGKVISLTPQQARMLEAIADIAPRGASRDYIAARTWPIENEPECSETVINVRMSQLRRKLRGTGVEIRNVWGHGYRLELTPPCEAAA